MRYQTREQSVAAAATEAGRTPWPLVAAPARVVDASMLGVQHLGEDVDDDTVVWRSGLG